MSVLAVVVVAKFKPDELAAPEAVNLVSEAKFAEMYVSIFSQLIVADVQRLACEELVWVEVAAVVTWVFD